MLYIAKNLCCPQYLDIWPNACWNCGFAVAYLWDRKFVGKIHLKIVLKIEQWLWSWTKGIVPWPRYFVLTAHQELVYQCLTSYVTQTQIWNSRHCLSATFGCKQTIHGDRHMLNLLTIQAFAILQKHILGPRGFLATIGFEPHLHDLWSWIKSSTARHHLPDTSSKKGTSLPHGQSIFSSRRAFMSLES